MAEQIRVHIPRRSDTLAYVETRSRKDGKIEAERIRMASKKSGSQSN